ncbi:hypothetical protein Mal64_05270 [Pseudobythopirellula maris]|uniref:Pilus assembly protein, PilO n=1 Tax=Pseudobythopirellula maris TaxID=2527991 RepID=A0A5C5ZVA1_9BACT|nr:hypothetical protein [Pseudobythopirellula maris]TWT90143.1 hypothetical protein Mal64_05270 [Pseudobythopirellula maris]
MSPRERNLLIGVVALVVLWGAWRGVTSYRDTLASSQARLFDASETLANAQFQADLAQRALRRLERWQEQSLASDPNVAQSGYQAWLIGAIDQAGLTLDNVRPTGTRERPDAYRVLNYSVMAEGPLDAVVRFLDTFYRLDALHKLTRLQLTPLASNRVRMELSIAALIVDGAPREEGMPGESDDRLRFASADRYVESLDGRNLFTAYQPPAPPREEPAPRERRPDPPPKPPFDDADQAFLSGVVGAGSSLQAWVTVRTTGEVLRLMAGDDLSVGLLKGRVDSITPLGLIYESEGERWRVPLGESLRDGKRLGAVDAT